MQNYDPKKIEAKWQKFWEKNKTFEVTENPKKSAQGGSAAVGKFYSLIEFPYPSGEGLHVGHPRPFTAMDVIARKKRMEGFNVLYPIGFDAFGLPTENFAIKTGQPPAEVTKKNIANFTRQLKSLGYSFDWSRVVDTTDPKYFKWTQWFFLQFFKHGLAYKKNQPINWCPKDKIGLANEEVVQGKCERCGTAVEKRDKAQWMLAITKYADKLLDGLKEVDYITPARVQQENWIGKSEGAEVKFALSNVILSEAKDLSGERLDSSVSPQNDNSVKELTVFTTRPDTIFGVTFIAVSAELAKGWIDRGWKPEKKIIEYIETTLKERVATEDQDEKEKTGIAAGFNATNPVNNETVPVWITNYVMGGVGTGAIMGVPAHDERDYEFAKKYNLPIKEVVVGTNVQEKAFTETGEVVNSDFLNGLPTPEAKEKMIQWLEEKKIGHRKINYKLRDWVFSRQRYWGEPIPLVYCEACAGWIPVPESELPLKLPKVEKYQPTDTGESPLAAMTKWVNTTCPKCGGPARRETDTMPNWAGSSWYFLRYTDPHNDQEFASMEKLKYWMPVDWYNGGMEHTVLHLLYSRFWNEFLYDIGAVPTREPYKKRTSHGMILGPDGEKMSKSRGNVINPDEMVEKFGTDAFRTYIMFMGPFDQAVMWDTNGLVGVRRFLDRVWNLQEKLTGVGHVILSGAKDLRGESLDSSSTSRRTQNDKHTTLLHQTIKKVTRDIGSMAFNTAVAALMQLTNELAKEEKISTSDYQMLLKLLSPFAPHISEELWEKYGDGKTLAFSPWPTYDEALTKEATLTIAVQVNGKVRATIEVAADASEEAVKQKALTEENVLKWIAGKEPKKIIYVKNKLLSIVV